MSTCSVTKSKSGVTRRGRASTLRGTELVRYRLSRRITQQQLAGELGVHRVTLARWERGDATSRANRSEGRPRRNRARSLDTEWRRRSEAYFRMIQQQHGEVRALDATARLAAEARVLARRAADLVKLLDAPRLNVCRDGGVRFGRPSDFGHPPAPFAKLGRIDEEL